MSIQIDTTSKSSDLLDGRGATMPEVNAHDPERGELPAWAAALDPIERRRPEAVLEHPLVHAYVSLRAFGDLTAHLDAVIGEIRDRTVAGDLVLIPCAGSTRKALTIARRLPAIRFLACDPSDEVVEHGRARADEFGLRNLTFEPSPPEELDLDEGALAIVACVSSLHHHPAPARFWEWTRRVLGGGGVALVQEYVGPDRFRFPPQQVELANQALDRLVSERHKSHHRRLDERTLADFVAADPTEAVHSSQILESCRDAGFTLPGFAGGGCGLLLPVLAFQVFGYDASDWDDNYELSALFREEDRAMREGLLGDDYAMFVAAPPA